MFGRVRVKSLAIYLLPHTDNIFDHQFEKGIAEAVLSKEIYVALSFNNLLD